MTAAPPLLRDRRGLVLGVSSENSVGYHCARRFRELGATVAVSHRPERRDRVPALARAIDCTAVELDAQDEASIERGVRQAAEPLERLDFLIHTLVHVPPGVLARPAVELSAADFRSALDVSVRSLLSACRHALPWLERSEAPRVVALLSSGGDFAIPNYHLAGIAKAALGAAVRYLALELGPRGVLCNAVSFSILDTDAAQRVIGAEETRRTRDYLAKRAPTRRPVGYDDVTGAIAFFASTLCQNVSGETLTVDGGFTHSYF